MAMPFFGSRAASLERRCAYSSAVIPGVTGKEESAFACPNQSSSTHVPQLSVNEDVFREVVDRTAAQPLIQKRIVDAGSALLCKLRVLR